MSTPTPPAGAEPSPEGAILDAIAYIDAGDRHTTDPAVVLCEAVKSLRAELERVRGLLTEALTDAEDQANWAKEYLDKQEAFRRERDELASENEKLVQANKVYERDEPKLRHEIVFLNESRDSLRKQIEHLSDEVEQLRARAEQDRSSIAELEYMSRNRTTTRIMLRNALQLALANAKYEEARRAGVKCFDESHPDNPTKPNS